MKRAATKTRAGWSLFLLATAGMMSCTGRGDLADGYGNFEAVQVTVSAEGNGKIQFLELTEGSRLEAQQTVGLIDTVQLSLKRELLMATKETIFSKSKNVLSQREVLLEELRLAKIDLNRVEGLIGEHAATQKQLDDVQGRVRIIEQKIKGVETLNAPIINEVKGIEVQIEQVADQIAKHYIKSPMDGTVLVQYAEAGEVAVFGKPLFKMADLREMDLRVYISEPQLPTLAIGQEVTVKVDDLESTRSFSGTVSWISDSAEFTPKIIQTKEERVNLVYAVKIRVRNDGSLKIGMPAEMWIEP